jgi:DNA-binding transcriptional regulator YdaS (Cro superfamily)
MDCFQLPYLGRCDSRWCCWRSYSHIYASCPIAVLPLYCNNHIVLSTQFQPGGCPRLEMISGGHGSANNLRSANRPELWEGGCTLLHIFIESVLLGREVSRDFANFYDHFKCLRGNEMLRESAYNGRFVRSHLSPDLVWSSITCEVSLRFGFGIIGGVVGSVWLDDIILHERICRPAVDREIRIAIWLKCTGVIDRSILYHM